MSASDYLEDQANDAVFNHETTGMPSADLWFQLHTGYPGENGASNVYSASRAQGSFGASSGGTVTNDGVIDIDVSTTDTVYAWSAWDASTSGNCIWWGWFGTVSGLAVVRSGDLTNNDVQTVAHGLAAADRVAFEVVEGLTLPAGLSASTLYYVIATGLTTDAFRVSTSSGGSAVDITGAGSAIWRKVVPVPFTGGQRVRFEIGTLNAIID